jgi:hypothetical protein
VLPKPLLRAECSICSRTLELKGGAVGLISKDNWRIILLLNFFNY